MFYSSVDASRHLQLLKQS